MKTNIWLLEIRNFHIIHFGSLSCKLAALYVGLIYLICSSAVYFCVVTSLSSLILLLQKNALILREWTIVLSFTTIKLRNRKDVSCFYRVIEIRVEIWENEKCCEQAFSQAAVQPSKGRPLLRNR